MKKLSAMCLIMMTAHIGMLVTGCITGTAHKDAKIYEPEFLTPKLKKQNLIGNPSFEDANSQAWSFGSWKSNPNAGCIVKVKGHDDKVNNCIEFSSVVPDVMWYAQPVRVKPKTKYLLSGWAKVENVTRGNIGMCGAVICAVPRGGTATVMLGTKDWTYLTCVFDSEDQTVINVQPQLGNWSSEVSGKAWFDELCLIELPTLKT